MIDGQEYVKKEIPAKNFKVGDYVKILHQTGQGERRLGKFGKIIELPSSSGSKDWMDAYIVEFAEKAGVFNGSRRN